MGAAIGGGTNNSARVDAILWGGAAGGLFGPGARREVVNVDYVELRERVVASAADSD